MHGLSGAHRTGKTTLAKNVSETCGIPFLPFKTTSVFDRLGLTYNDITSVDDHLFLNRHILEYGYALWRSSPEDVFITDRTPIDIAAYMMLAVGPYVVTSPATQRGIESLVSDCKEVAVEIFKTITLIPPGLPYKEEDGKPRDDKALQMGHHLLCLGMIHTPELRSTRKSFMRDGLNDLGHRTSIMQQVIYGIANETIFEGSVEIFH